MSLSNTITNPRYITIFYDMYRTGFISVLSINNFLKIQNNNNGKKKEKKKCVSIPQYTINFLIMPNPNNKQFTLFRQDTKAIEYDQ